MDNVLFIHWNTFFQPKIYLKWSGLLSQVYDYNLTWIMWEWNVFVEFILYFNGNCYTEEKKTNSLEENMRKKGNNLCIGSISGPSFLAYSLPSFSLLPVPLHVFLLTFPLPLSLLTSGGYLPWLCDSSPAMGQLVFGLDVRLQCASANLGRTG